MSESPHGCWYDPELPFLRELEREVHRWAERAARERRGTAPPPPPSTRRPMTSPQCTAPSRSRRWRAFAPARVARRSVTLLVLLCLIGASAYGARQVLSGAGPSPLDAQRGELLGVAHGGSGPGAWSLSLYERAGELCRVLALPEAESSRCSQPPAPGAVSVTSAASPLRRYVFGVSGERVVRVALRMGASVSTVPTHPIGGAGARAAGLPRGTRYYVGALPRGAGGYDPAVLVRGIDATGRPTGPPLAACLETLESPDARTHC